MSKYSLLDNDEVKHSYRYKKFMRDGSVQEITAVVRSRASKKKAKKDAQKDKTSG